MYLEEFGFDGAEDWASLILVRVYSRAEVKRLLGYVFVIDRKFGENSKWKLPGGHKEVGDKTPKESAIRELYEEARIRVTHVQVSYIEKWLMDKDQRHWVCLFTCNVFMSDLSNMGPGRDGENPQYFTVDGLRRLFAGIDFLPSHKEKLQEFKLV